MSITGLAPSPRTMDGTAGLGSVLQSRSGGYAHEQRRSSHDLASQYQPDQFANATEIVGALHQDRHSGIMGVLGQEWT